MQKFLQAFAKYRERNIGPNIKNGYYNKDYKYDAGIYYLNGKMGVEGMLVAFQGNNATAETVSLMFPEGTTVPEIVQKLADNEVCDKTALLSVIQSADFSYSLVSDLKASEQVPYRLEGYLFLIRMNFMLVKLQTLLSKNSLQTGILRLKKNTEHVQRNLDIL